MRNWGLLVMAIEITSVGEKSFKLEAVIVTFKTRPNALVYVVFIILKLN